MVDLYTWLHLFKGVGGSEIDFEVLVKDYDSFWGYMDAGTFWNQKTLSHCRDIDAQT